MSNVTDMFRIIQEGSIVYEGIPSQNLYTREYHERR